MSIQEIIAAFSNYRILVIGDIILDHYAFGTVNRISPEAPIQILDLQQQEYRLGGAGNVARNLAKLHAQVTLCGVLGKDSPCSSIFQLLEQDNINIQGIFQDPSRPTIIKSRFIAHGHHLLRVDCEVKKALSRDMAYMVLEFLKKEIPKHDGVILSDYAKGMFLDSEENFVQKILNLAREHHKKVFVGPKGKDWGKYQGAYLLSANRSETEMICGISLTCQDDIKREAYNILKNLELEAMLVTLGAQGMYLVNQNQQSYYVPAQAKEVFDVVGAGDTVLSLLSLSLIHGLPWEIAMKIGNAGAGIVVGKIGTSVVLPEELEKACFF